jgi:hypothetical protein
MRILNIMQIYGKMLGMGIGDMGIWGYARYVGYAGRDRACPVCTGMRDYPGMHDYAGMRDYPGMRDYASMHDYPGMHDYPCIHDNPSMRDDPA